MERKIGSIFGFVDSFVVDEEEIIDDCVAFNVKVTKLQVVENTSSVMDCSGCYFEHNCKCFDNWKRLGSCIGISRKDKTNVIFKAIK